MLIIGLLEIGRTTLLRQRDLVLGQTRDKTRDSAMP